MTQLVVKVPLEEKVDADLAAFMRGGNNSGPDMVTVVVGTNLWKAAETQGLAKTYRFGSGDGGNSYAKGQVAAYNG